MLENTSTNPDKLLVYPFASSPVSLLFCFCLAICLSIYLSSFTIVLVMLPLMGPELNYITYIPHGYHLLHMKYPLWFFGMDLF